jgi:hypothetical protein
MSRNLDFDRDLLSRLRPVLTNDTLQLAPDETRTTTILPVGHLIDRLQHITWNVADRQNLNNGPLRRWSNGLRPLATSCFQIDLVRRPRRLAPRDCNCFAYIY